VVDERGDLLVVEEAFGDGLAEDLRFDDVVDGAADVAAFVLLADVALAEPVVGGFLLGRVQGGGDEAGRVAKASSAVRFADQNTSCGLGNPWLRMVVTRRSLMSVPGTRYQPWEGWGMRSGPVGAGAAALRRPAAGAVVAPAAAPGSPRRSRNPSRETSRQRRQRLTPDRDLVPDTLGELLHEELLGLPPVVLAGGAAVLGDLHEEVEELSSSVIVSITWTK
jgi:hypothetical protein